MTKEEAINRVKAGAPFSEIYDPTWEEALNTLILASENNREWIPVSERNPNIYKRVEKYLITDDEGQVRTACFINAGDACWWDYLHVVAWQPLPEPYKEKGSE